MTPKRKEPEVIKTGLRSKKTEKMATACFVGVAKYLEVDTMVLLQYIRRREEIGLVKDY